MKRYVKAANFHQSAFLNGTSIGNALPVTNRAESKNWVMTTSEYGIMVTVRGSDCLIPWANVSGCTLGEQVAATEKAPTVSG